MSERPLRILVLANLPPHVLGGAENQVARLVEAWRDLGAWVEVAGHRIPTSIQSIGDHQIPTHQLRTWPALGRFGRGLGYALSLLRLMLGRRHDFDVVYCRGLGDGVLALSLWLRLGLWSWKVLAVPINAAGTGDAHFLRSVPGSKILLRWIDRQIHAFNLINADIADDLDALGLRRARRTSIPNGIPLQPRLERSVPPAVRRLVWTGRLEAQKGLDLLLDALAACRQEGARFHLSLWGDGSLRKSLQNQAEILGLAGVVSFRGSCPPEQVRDALLDADAFVLPSRYEGMSNSALEAMEASLPVLCTRCGGIDSVIEEGAGWTCRPGDMSALQEALRRMFAEPGDRWLARGRRARAMVEERFAIASVAAANLEVMKRLVDAPEGS